VHLLETIREVISAIFQWVFILAAATSPIVLNLWAWMRLRRPPVPEIGPPWQRRVAYLSFTINFFAYVLPLAALIRNSGLLDSGRALQADELVDWRLLQDVLIASVALSVGLAALGPKYVRIQLILSMRWEFGGHSTPAASGCRCRGGRAIDRLLISASIGR
jgi:hypothetical protein